MDFYSASLLLSMVAAGVGLILAVAVRLGGAAPPVRRAASVAGMAGAGLAVVTMVYHLATGHAPGSMTAMGPMAFGTAHPAPLVVFGVSASALALLRHWSAKPTSNRSES